MANHFQVACVQMCSSRNVAENIKQACALIEAAADAGADLVITPEMTSLLEQQTKVLFANVFKEEDDPALKRFRDVARERGIWLVIGSLPIWLSDTQIANRCYVLSPQGDVVSFYDKIHMFDVDLAGGESYRESQNFQPGERGVVAQTPWGGLGLSICYDVRFPALYRDLAQNGASFLTVPAAFTQQTGEAHWHVLLQARAIETGCYVFASAQTGQHECGRHTYGHSLIISPWGEVLADGQTDVGFISASIDLDDVARARTKVPSLQHDRPFRTEP